MIKRLPSMIVPVMLLIAVLSTSAVKPAEYVRISPSAMARPQVRVARSTPSGRSARRQPMPANFDPKRRCAIGLRNPRQLEPLDEPCQGLDRLLAVPLCEDVLCDPR